MILIKNANVLALTVNSDKPVLSDVLIDGGKIREISPNISVSDAERVIEAEGRLLTPGLIDAHTHIGLFLENTEVAEMDVNEMSDTVTPQLRAIDAINPRSEAFAEALRSGVTTLMTGPGSANVIGGQFALIKTAGNIIDDMIVKAPAAMKIAFGENPKMCYGIEQKKAPATRMATAAILRETLFKTREYDRLQKLAEEKGGNPPAFDIKLEAMLPVIRNEIPLKAHAHMLNDIFTAIRIAKEFNLNITIDHCTEGALAADRLAEEIEYAIVGPTLGFREKPELAEMNFDSVAKMSKAGIKVCIITDYPVVPFEAFATSAGWCVKAGMPEIEAWRGITRYPAEVLGIADKVGTIEVSKEADLVLFDGNPLRDVVSGAALTMINGKIVYENL